MRQTILIGVAGFALLLILGGCFQKPVFVESDRVCDPAALVVAEERTPPSTASNRQRLGSDHLTLFVWNSFKGKVDGWLNDLSMLSQGHDLLLLQEAYLKDDLLAFLGDPALNWSMATTFRYKTIPTGVLTASRVTADQHCQMTAMEPWIRLPKAILISRYPLAGSTEKLVVANVHLINFTFNTGAYQDQLSRLKSILEQHRGPLIVAGDFNTWSRERSHLVEEFMTGLQLRPVDFSGSLRSEIFGRKVDHVYFRQMAVTAARAIDVTTSDHNPMAVTFSLTDHGSRPVTPVGQKETNVVPSVIDSNQKTTSLINHPDAP